MNLKLVRKLPPWKKGQTLELYEWGEQKVVVSTVALSLDAVADPLSRAIAGLSSAFGGYATSGEETMAFPCDDQGEPTSWRELARANGDGSRASVLEQLRGKTKRRDQAPFAEAD